MLNLSALNEAQREAVVHGEGPLLVLAGPGSGKTFTITQRILYLIEVMQADPSAILVITFTKEAALSMQRRFLEQSSQTYPVNFGTFHSVFYQILRNVNPSQTKQIWGESQKKNLIISILKNLNSRDADAVNRNYTEEAQSLLSAISFYKNTGDMEQSLKKLSQEQRAHFQEIFRLYEKKRKEQAAIDFDDMVYECANMLEKSPDARAYWSKRFSHILMDEFQDINPMQYRVINLLATKPYNLFAVGDDDQAIYGFRGSRPACMKQFVEDFNAKRLLLNINYRSYKEIVDASLRVIEVNKERFAKKLLPCQEKIAEEEQRNAEWLNPKEANPKRLNPKERNQKSLSFKNSIVALQSFAVREEEYDYLMQSLERENEWGEEINRQRSCAVLFRTNMYMQGFAARLDRKGIPYEMKEKAGNIYEHFIVKDIMAYLRIAHGEENRALFLQILNKPVRFISREALYQAAASKSEHSRGYPSVHKAAGSGTILQQMREYYRQQAKECCREAVPGGKALHGISLLEKQLGYIKNVSPYLAVQYICKVIGYERYLMEAQRKQNSAPECPEEWQEVLEFVKGEAREYDTLEAWQEAQMQFTQKLKSGTALQRKARPSIHLMTVHASKGLEFDKVYIPDCNEKIFPHGNMPDKETCEEECRIFYVAMTRAKKSLELLYLTGTKERPRLPSRFLNPLL